VIKRKAAIRDKKAAGKAQAPAPWHPPGHQIGQDREKETTMRLSRRCFLNLAGASIAASATSSTARAQTYPTRPVHIIVGFPAGGGADIIARLTGQWLSERLGQQFLVENRTGASTNIAAEAVVNSPPDGHTLLLATSTNAINATLYEKLNFSFIRDIAPVASLVESPLVMLVHPSFPAKTVPQFISYAKANPGKINMASSGTGTTPHVAGELFKLMTGVNMIHVPYRGDPPAISDLLGEQVQVYFSTLPGSIEYIKSGKLRALAVTTSTRWETLPEIPTVGEFVPGFESNLWFGVGAPKNTPAEIVSKLNREINSGLADPKMKALFADLGCAPLTGSPADYGRVIAEDTEKWGKVVRFSGAKAD
jgi:tripartite-type tricarboxylate transporter receptor subunit TctC